MKKRHFILIAILFVAIFSIVGYKVPVSAASLGKVVCVNKIKGKYVYYNNCNVNIETPEIKGVLKKAKITKKTKYYCYLNDDFDATTEVPRVSKKTFINAIKDAKIWNAEGFYVFGKFKKGKCTKLMEPYWP